MRAFRFDKAICRDIVRLGVPSGFLVALESGLFAAVSVYPVLLARKRSPTRLLCLG